MRLLIYGDIGGSGGYIRYCKGLLGNNAVPKDMEVWFICSSPFYEQLAPLDPNIHVITHPWLLSKHRFQRILWYLWIFPRLVRKIKPDVEFYPSGQLRVYLRKAFAIATCHNLLLFDRKELNDISSLSEQRYLLNYRKKQASSFLKSNGLIFLSKYSKEIIFKELGPINNSTIIAHGLDSIFRLSTERSYEFTSEIKLLYVSPYYHYKHQLEVVKAVQLIRNSTGLNVSLYLIGGGVSSAAVELDSYVKNENVNDFIFVKGNVNYKNLLEEYRTADIFVFASSCETFGITILEAMAARLPIACSNRTGLSEILKDAGVYFDPENPESISESLQKLINNLGLRKFCGERGYQYSKDYTWERCAFETFEYIKSLKSK